MKDAKLQDSELSKRKNINRLRTGNSVVPHDGGMSVEL